MSNLQLTRDVLLDKDYSETISNQNLQSSTIFQLEFYSSDSKIQYTRKYKKIQDVISQIGGFLSIIIILCKAIVRLYSKYAFAYRLINEIFELEDQDINQTQKDKKQNKIDDETEIKLNLQDNKNIKIKPDFQNLGKFEQKNFGQGSTRKNIQKHQVAALDSFTQQKRTEVKQEKENQYSNLYSDATKEQLNCQDIQNIELNPKQELPQKKQNTFKEENLLEKNVVEFGVQETYQKSNITENLFLKCSKDLNQEEKQYLLNTQRENLKITSNEIDKNQNIKMCRAISHSQDDLLQRHQVINLQISAKKKIQYLKVKMKPDDHLKLNFFKYYFQKLLNICKKSNENKQIKKSQKQIEIFNQAYDAFYDFFEAEFLVKKMLEIDRLKEIIFNEEQITIFNYLSKPNIKKNVLATPSFEQKKSLLIENSFVQKELDKVLEFCNKVLNKKTANIIDMKLYSLIDKKLFQHAKIKTK